MKKYSRYAAAAAALLAVLLAAGALYLVLTIGRAEPANPLTADPEPLRTETAGGITEADTASASEEQEPDVPETPEEQTAPEQETEQKETQQLTPNDTGESDTSQTSGVDGQEAALLGNEGKPNGSGEGSGDSGESGQPEGEEAGLVTDLYTGMIVKVSDLQNDRLHFYAYYSAPDVDAGIQVSLRHKTETGNGTRLPADGVNYTARLQLGSNRISITYTDAEGTRHVSLFVITYAADKADEENPVIGETPPTIETNLDGWTEDIRTREFTLTVKAKNGSTGKTLYSNHIQVTMDGKTIKNPTGSGTYEYVLYFERPNVGDREKHTVTVLAWDDDGNSRYQSYEVWYYATDDGEIIGTVTIAIDATVVGLGIIDEAEYDIVQGEPAAATVKAMLEDYGYEVVADGSVKVGYYLRSLSRADAFLGAAVPDRLMTFLTRDGITMTSPCTRDTLSEFDFTMGSGWMYCLNGKLFPGKGLSDYYLNDGDSIVLRYTLAWGKDIGGYVSENGGYGNLSAYCGIWVNGEYTPLSHHWNTETPLRVEPTATEDGYVEYTCSLCGETYRETLTHTGTIDPTEPTDPTEPIDPTEPDEPADPSEPAEPAEATNPTENES